MIYLSSDAGVWWGGSLRYGDERCDDGRVVDKRLRQTEARTHDKECREPVPTTDRGTHASTQHHPGVRATHITRYTRCTRYVHSAVGVWKAARCWVIYMHDASVVHEMFIQTPLPVRYTLYIWIRIYQDMAYLTGRVYTYIRRISQGGACAAAIVFAFGVSTALDNEHSRCGPPLQNRLVTPELQWQPRGKWRISKGRHTPSTPAGYP